MATAGQPIWESLYALLVQYGASQPEPEVNDIVSYCKSEGSKLAGGTFKRRGSR